MKRNMVKICCLVVLASLLVGIFSAFIPILTTPSIVRAAPMENRNPNPPVITGPTSGNINRNYPYTFLLTDPDGDPLKAIQIEWGGSEVGNFTYICWLCQGSPKENGTLFEYSHFWQEKGTYTIRAKVWDLPGNESEWATLTVTMPCSSERPIPWLFELLFQRFPYAFPVLRHVMGY